MKEAKLFNVPFSSLYTHKQLVDIAFQWAKGRHDIVIKEKNEGDEIPDVVGFNLSWSTLIECKVSRADFYRDKKKYSRLYNDMIGNYRIYCAPKGLLKREDLPEKWGLLEVYPSGHARLLQNIYRGWGGSWFHPLETRGYRNERHLIFTAIRDRADISQKDKIFSKFL